MVAIQVDDHILLRTFNPDDAPALFDVIQNNRTHLRPWLSWIDGTTRQEHAVLFIEEALRQENLQKGLALGIFKDTQIIGGLGMTLWDHQLKKANVGYWISEDLEGKGIMSQCLIRFLDFLFGKLNLNKVEIQFMTTNKKSAGLARKLNATIEGVLRESYLVNGKLEDLVVAGILRKEWNSFITD